MKKICLVCALVAWACFDIKAQKQDNVWVFGYRYGANALANGIYLTFGDTVEVTYKPKPMALGRSNAMICDSSGQLLIITNGCYIEAADGKKIEDTDDLNPGIGNDLFCPQNKGGYNIGQNMILLPYPHSDRRYCLFHIPDVDLGTYATLHQILHTIVEQKEDDSWHWLKKSEGIVDDTMDYDGLHAVKHANGRDWWVVAPKRESNTYYFLLLDPYGIKIQKQSIGAYPRRDDRGSICFSPDGSKMARYGVRDDLIIFDFDRCTGTLSNPIYIPIDDENDGEFFSGLAFSADGRFLYTAAIGDIYQFDTWASDIAASRVIIAEWDKTDRCPFLVSFAQMEFGPDGRIYCRTADGQDCMHRIKNPEKIGGECGFQYKYYNFKYSFAGLPHFPNFRLGPIDGSPCDTLGLDNHPLAGWRHDAESLGVEFTSVSWYEPERWQWWFGDGMGSAERNPQHTYAAPGLYRVCLAVSNANGADTLCKTIRVGTVSSGGEPSPAAGVGKLHPNPTTGLLYWRGPGLPARARVFDVLGRLCQESVFQAGTLDAGALVPGPYFVQVFDEGGGLLARQQVVVVD